MNEQSVSGNNQEQGFTQSSIRDGLEHWIRTGESPKNVSEEPEERAEDVEQVTGDEPTDQPAETEDESGLDESSQDEAEGEESGDEIVTLTIDGETFELPAELANTMTKMQRKMQAEFTRKTQEAAEMRKAAQALQEQTISKLQFEKENLDLITKENAILEHLRQYENVDWIALAEQDNKLYLTHKEARESLREELNKVRAELAKRYDMSVQQKNEMEKQISRAVVDTVTKAIPDYFDKYDTRVLETATKIANRIGIKIDDAMIRRISMDPLIIIGLAELSDYYALKEKKPVPEKKVVDVKKFPKTSMKPQKSSTDKAEKIRKLLQSGRLREAAEL